MTEVAEKEESGYVYRGRFGRGAVPVSSDRIDAVMQYVEKGGELFDDRCPGWLDKIDLSKLDVWSTDYCPVGQVVDDPSGRMCWDQKLKALGIDEDLSRRYGFEQRDDVSYAELTAGWDRYIRTRRAAEAA